MIIRNRYVLVITNDVTHRCNNAAARARTATTVSAATDRELIYCRGFPILTATRRDRLQNHKKKTNFALRRVQFAKRTSEHNIVSMKRINTS